MKHFFVIFTKERKFETTFGRIKCDHVRAGGTIETAYRLALDTCQIDEIVKGTYDSMIAVCICQLSILTVVKIIILEEDSIYVVQRKSPASSHVPDLMQMIS